MRRRQKKIPLFKIEVVRVSLLKIVIAYLTNIFTVDLRYRVDSRLTDAISSETIAWYHGSSHVSIPQVV